MDALSKPFQIGIRPIKESDWLAIDERLPTRAAQRQALLATRRATVYGALADAAGLEQAVYDQVRDWLVRFAAPQPIPLDDATQGGPGADDSALVRAALAINEDLLVLRREAAGWRLVAGFVAFPSRWSLAEKLGKTLDDVHGPVPGFQRASRNADLITRMFDRLRDEQIIGRSNWSLHDTDRLHQPGGTADTERPVREQRDETLWLRQEIQRVRRLPETEAIVFTIDTRLKRFTDLDLDQRSAARQAMALLDSAQQRYKGW